MSGFPPDLFAGRRYAVVGLGRAGLAAMRALAAMGASVTGWDDAAFARTAALQEGFRVQDPAADIGDYHALVLSPGIPHLLPVPHRTATAALLAGRPILTDAELLYQAVRAAGSRARFAGITGTNGKSTTTALLAHILAGAGLPCAAGANLGPAALSLELLPHDGVYVLEMSSYMLERLATLRFDVACMLNLSPDHLDRHGDMAGYEAAKCQIFARQLPQDAAIWPAHRPCRASTTRRMRRRQRRWRWRWGSAASGSLRGSRAFPACRTGRSTSPRWPASASSTTARRRMPTRPGGPWPAMTALCGSPAALPRPAGSMRWLGIFRVWPRRF
jgi:UDP-N-acetylmuramoylalanine--D-glutamate ligase